MSETDEEENVERLNTLPKVDRHGFVIDHRLHSRVKSLPNPATLGEIGKRRELKWLEMIDKWDQYMSKSSDKIRDRCIKGIPQSVRSLAWQHLSGAHVLIKKNPGVYDELSSKAHTQWSDVIMKDIPRTFRHHCMFHEDDSQGQENLYRVLLAYSEYDPEIGYSQALAPIAAVLLMHMPPNETFWVLVALCRYYLPGYYGEKMEAMKLDGLIFAILLEAHLPRISKHMKDLNIDPLMYIVEWMVCIYSRCLPFQTVLRIWDLFFCEGIKVLFKIGLSILKIVFPTQKDLDGKDDFQTTNLINNLPNELMTDIVLINQAQQLNITDKEFERVHKQVYKDHPELHVYRFKCGEH